ncbi:hypothetical protein BN7_4953 [Wickerhamomyces ciferrii]|uniref:FMN hydroxy acid dehydrogenase domain-containing protein n=1 Tax=Wickerhamomyces ciferrii (strain ATCC 14091 / BCRC 22168 / CBS 111 / JCM 3599 / NBRC 0793 / NRRL Y-1031 F-60-10) TaxID=1206466 RepID=K0KQN5_WICCF|nr:uncharacterized protein BN7_4953 [Wickerhamomyces ciferrii]CCH45371.1 hypothetical protein BN7_4953 [Wickerhamomyces ciferrii]
MTQEFKINDDDLVIIQNHAYKLSNLPADLKFQLVQKLQSNNDQAYTKPDISKIFNLNDFEPIAQKLLTPETYAYYRTGAEDEITLRENQKAFKRIYFKPRVLKSVSKISLETSVLGSYSSLPFYITAFHGASFDGNNEGELPLAKSAGKYDLIQMIPGLSTIPLKQQVQSHGNVEVDQWLQVYLRESFDEVLEKIKKAEETGKIKAIFFTVDVAQLGRREHESRIRDRSDYVKVPQLASDLNWDDLIKIRQSTNLKIILKGIQSVEDAIKSVELGFEGFVISNHGGRQLDTTRSSIEVLGEIVPELKKRNLYHKTEILIDGGVRRGSDIIKALALGAKSVGLGRPFLYALQTYGEEGISKVIDILREELTITLKLLGVVKLEELNETFVDTIDLYRNRA